MSRARAPRRPTPAVLLVAALACRADGGSGPGGPAPGGGPQPLLVQTVPIPPNYGIHDTFVRDGLAFVFAWNSGVLIYDVGNGMKGGSPAAPALVGSVVTGQSGISGGAQVHNGWWYWSPDTAVGKRYLFVGQEGPAVGGIGVGSSGLIHVVDVSDLAHPTEVAYFHKPGTDSTGTHNFWVDEQRQILYAAYYNGGVVALDISGTLSGDLAGRLIDSLRPGGPGDRYTWGVQLSNGSLYAVDMLSGLWQLGADSGTLSVAGGGDNEAARYSSDLWVANGYAYTGTWDHVRRTSQPGSLLKVWRLGAGGAPAAVDSIAVANVGAVSDVEVSADGTLLMFSAEGGSAGGLYFYRLTDPAHPSFLAFYPVDTGLHTATFGAVGAKRYAFAAKNPASPALMIWDVTGLDP